VNRLRRPSLRLIITTVILLLADAAALFPIYWTIVTSFKLPAEIFSAVPTFIPRKPTLINYQLTMWPASVNWEKIRYELTSYITVVTEEGLRYILNSIVVASATTLLSLMLGSMAAYAISRFRVGGKNLEIWILSNRAMPPIVLIIPYFIIMKNFRLLDTHLALILAYLTFNLPFAIWLMKGFFDEIPVELEEAAMIDGCSRFRAFLKVVLPISRSGLLTTAIFTFIFSWNEFFFALILTTRNAVTVPVLDSKFISIMGSLYGEMAAAATVTMVPIIALALVVQRYLVRGLTLGAVRG